MKPNEHKNIPLEKALTRLVFLYPDGFRKLQASPGEFFMRICEEIEFRRSNDPEEDDDFGKNVD